MHLISLELLGLRLVVDVCVRLRAFSRRRSLCSYALGACNVGEPLFIGGRTVLLHNLELRHPSEGHVHPVLPGGTVVGAFPLGRHAASIRAHPERGPHRSARLGRGWSRYSGDVAATDEGPHTVLVNPGMQDRDVALVVIGAAGERISSRVVFDELNRLDSLIPDHDVDVVDKEEAAREPFVNVGSGDRDRNLANDVALGPPSATSAPSR
jgi:hypothetical protein